MRPWIVAGDVEKSLPIDGVRFEVVHGASTEPAAQLIRKKNDVVAPDLASGQDACAVQGEAAVDDVHVPAWCLLPWCKHSGREFHRQVDFEVCSAMVEERNALQPPAVGGPRHLALKRGRHHTVKVLGLVEVLTQAPAHVRGQTFVGHEHVKIVHVATKLATVRIKGCDHAAEGADHLAPEEAAQHHQYRSDELLGSVEWCGRDVAIANRRDGHDCPIEACTVHWPRIDALTGHGARIRIPDSCSHAILLVAHPRVHVKHVLIRVYRINVRVLGVFANRAEHRDRRNRPIEDNGLQSPDACKPVRGNEDADNAFAQSQCAIVDGKLALPPAQPVRDLVRVLRFGLVTKSSQRCVASGAPLEHARSAHKTNELD
eukprot:scaffold114885_cov63-Phaeocystis_antarctica.AAC.1